MKNISTSKETLGALNRLSGGNDTTILATRSFGSIAVWNVADCLLNGIEEEGNDAIRHVESFLSCETSEVQAFFSAIGFVW